MCDEIRKMIPAHSIGATDAEEVTQINRRLAECPDTAAELAMYRAMAERMLYSASTVQPPPQIEKRLRAAIADANTDVLSAKSQDTLNPLTARRNNAYQSLHQSPPLVNHQPLRQAQQNQTMSARPFSPVAGNLVQARRAFPSALQRGRKMPSRTMQGLNRQRRTPAKLPAAMAMYQLQPESAVRLPLSKSANQSMSAPTATLRNPWHFGRFLATAAVLALVFINLALLTQNQQLRQQQQDVAGYLAQQSQALILLAAEEPQEIEIFAPDGVSSAKADILWNEDLGIAVVYVRNFPQCDPGMKYQLWLTKDGERRSGGLFSVDSSGMGLLVMPVEHSIELYDSIGITPEPDEGSPGPTAPPVVRGDI